MVRSMTGFAHAQGEDGSCQIRVTLKALNHRFLDLHLRVPGELEPFEPRWRTLVREKIHRGHLEVDFQVESREKPALEVNTEFVRSYVELYRNLQREFGLTGEPDLAAALRQPGVLRTGARTTEPEAAQRIGALAERLLQEALARLEEMRRNEGVALERDLLNVLEQVRERRQQLVKLSSTRCPLFTSSSASVAGIAGKDGPRPHAAGRGSRLLAERSDTSEELARLEVTWRSSRNCLPGRGFRQATRFLAAGDEPRDQHHSLQGSRPGRGRSGDHQSRVGDEGPHRAAARASAERGVGMSLLCFIVSGPSGSGKTSVVQHLLSTVPRLLFSVSYTTRAPRAGEQDGREYHFVKPEEFKQMIARRELLEYAQVFGHYYGSHRDALEEAARQGSDLLLDIDVQGAQQVKERLPDAVAIFVLPPSWQELEHRLRARGLDAPEAIQRRLRCAREEIEPRPTSMTIWW
jgi:guanylate kinase